MSEDGWPQTDTGCVACWQREAEPGDQAVTDLDHAADIARGQGYGPGEGRAVHDLGIVLAAGGDRDRGRERLDSALRLFQEMGAHAYADRTKRAITGL